MKKLPQLSLFFPCLNDARSLPSLIQKANLVAKHVASDYEILVINDGSTDNSAQVLKQLEKQYSHLRTITHPQNKGYGAALKSGFSHTKFDWIFYTDGDGQYDPTELKYLVKLVSPKVDVINGYKIQRSDHWIRKAAGWLYNRFIHSISRLPIRDIDCDFRLIRRSALSSISLVSDTGTICLELISKLYAKGAKFSEVPVHHYPRKFGKSEFFRPLHLFAMLRSFTRSRF